MSYAASDEELLGGIAEARPLEVHLYMFSKIVYVSNRKVALVRMLEKKVLEIIRITGG